MFGASSIRPGTEPKLRRRDRPTTEPYSPTAASSRLGEIDTRLDSGPGLWETLGVWIFVAFATLAIFITYARLPVTDVYHVSQSGLAGGASRALVYLNFPVAFIAIAIAGFAVARVLARSNEVPSTKQRIAVAGAVVAVALCLVAGWPGVVQQSDLDAKPINVVPALGVFVAAGVTIYAVRLTSSGAWSQWSAGDAIRLGIGLILMFLALPWVLADLGVYVGDVPLIGDLFMSKQILSGETLRVVHLGDHHGYNGVLFALVALALSRPALRIGQTWLRRTIALYLTFMFVYGVTNAAQDFWGEQIVARGWTDARFPSVIVPHLTLEWGLMLVATIALWLLLLLIGRRFESTRREVSDA